MDNNSNNITNNQYFVPSPQKKGTFTFDEGDKISNHCYCTNLGNNSRSIRFLGFAWTNIYIYIDVYICIYLYKDIYRYFLLLLDKTLS